MPLKSQIAIGPYGEKFATWMPILCVKDVLQILPVQPIFTVDCAILLYLSWVHGMVDIVGLPVNRCYTSLPY